MLRVSQPIGFVIGFVLGVYTRDNHLYPHPMRVSDLEEDYTKMESELAGRREELAKTVEKMSDQLQKQQGAYVAMKHKVYAEEEENARKKAVENSKAKGKK